MGKHLDHNRERQTCKRIFLERELPLHREDLVTLLSEDNKVFEAFGTSLPFALAGLASLGVVAARSLAFRLINVFDSSNPDAHDRVATAFLSRAQVVGHCRAIQEWAQSDLPMSAFPLLQREVAALRLVPMVEWHAERPHAIMKKATTGKKAYGRAASLGARLRESRDIACHPEGRSMLAETFRLHASPFVVAIEIGIDDQSTLVKLATTTTAASERRNLWSRNNKLQQDPRRDALSHRHRQPVAEVLERREPKHGFSGASSWRCLPTAKAPVGLGRLVAQKWWSHLQSQGCLKAGVVLDLPTDFTGLSPTLFVSSHWIFRSSAMTSNCRRRQDMHRVIRRRLGTGGRILMENVIVGAFQRDHEEARAWCRGFLALSDCALSPSSLDSLECAFDLHCMASHRAEPLR